MVSNANKIALVSYDRRQNLPTAAYTINEFIIFPFSSIFKYLGVKISQNLNRSSHVRKIVNNANKALGYIYLTCPFSSQITRLQNNNSPEVRVHIFHLVVTPN